MNFPAAIAIRTVESSLAKSFHYPLKNSEKLHVNVQLQKFEFTEYLQLALLSMLYIRYNDPLFDKNS